VSGVAVADEESLFGLWNDIALGALSFRVWCGSSSVVLEGTSSSSGAGLTMILSVLGKDGAAEEEEEEDGDDDDEEWEAPVESTMVLALSHHKNDTDQTMKQQAGEQTGGSRQGRRGAGANRGKQ